MRRYDSVGPATIEFAKDGFRDGTSRSRLRTRTELIDQHESAVISLCQHFLHVHKEGAVCTEVIVDRLVVSYVNHDPVEHQHLRSLRSRDEHAPLEHIL